MSESDMNHVTKVVTKINQEIEILLENLKNQCLTYADLENKLFLLKRQSAWSGNSIAINLIEEVIKLIEKEKSNSPIANRP